MTKVTEVDLMSHGKVQVTTYNSFPNLLFVRIPGDLDYRRRDLELDTTEARELVKALKKHIKKAEGK